MLLYKYFFFSLNSNILNESTNILLNPSIINLGHSHKPKCKYHNQSECLESNPGLNLGVLKGLLVLDKKISVVNHFNREKPIIPSY